MGHENSKHSQRLDNTKDHEQSKSEDRLHVGHDYSEVNEETERIQDNDESKSEELTNDDAYRGAQIPVTRIQYNLPVFVVLNKEIDLSADKKQSFFDCIILGNKLVFTDINNSRLVIFNEDDNDISYIPLLYKPWGITGVTNDSVAISFPLVHIIQIINICTRAVDVQIENKNECWGISFHEDLLYYVSGGVFIIKDVDGNMKGSFPLPSADISKIAVDAERLFCTDREIVYCCDLQGTIKWEFKVDTLTGLHGVTIDGHGNVYVAGEWSNNVVSISPNGKRCRIILTTSDRIDSPTGLYFDKNEQRLLVCNCSGDTIVVFNTKKNEKLLKVLS